MSTPHLSRKTLPNLQGDCRSLCVHEGDEVVASLLVQGRALAPSETSAKTRLKLEQWSQWAPSSECAVVFRGAGLLTEDHTEEQLGAALAFGSVSAEALDTEEGVFLALQIHEPFLFAWGALGHDTLRQEQLRTWCLSRYAGRALELIDAACRLSPVHGLTLDFDPAWDESYPQFKRQISTGCLRKWLELKNWSALEHRCAA